VKEGEVWSREGRGLDRRAGRIGGGFERTGWYHTGGVRMSVDLRRRETASGTWEGSLRMATDGPRERDER